MKRPCQQTSAYLLKHTTRTVRAFISRILYKIDVNTLHREREVETLSLNEIGRVEIRIASPIFFDPYQVNHGTGSFILIDPLTNNTVAAGMIRGPVRKVDELLEGAEAEMVKAEEHRPTPSGAAGTSPGKQGKSGMATKARFCGLRATRDPGNRPSHGILKKSCLKPVFRRCFSTETISGRGCAVIWGSPTRTGRKTSAGSGEVARLFFESGHMVICTFISPFEKDRSFVRSLFPEGRFFEIYVKCDLDVCKRRDPNGLYRKTMAGEIKEFTGISSPYEAPEIRKSLWKQICKA